MSFQAITNSCMATRADASSILSRVPDSMTMAASTSTAVTINLMPVSEKLVHGNHTLWKAQVLAVLRVAQLADFLDGTNLAPAEKIKLNTQKESAEEIEEVSNPAYEVWKAQEKQVLSYLLTSVSRDVLVQVAILPTAAEVWKYIETLFASHSCA
jgi:hypothetical protein